MFNTCNLNSVWDEHGGNQSVYDKCCLRSVGKSFLFVIYGLFIILECG